MSNPIGALIAAFGGGVGAYDQANQRQATQDRADQEQQRRLALEDLQQQEVLQRMGAHPGTAPKLPAPVAQSAPQPAAAQPSSADAISALVRNTATPANTGDSSAQPFMANAPSAPSAPAPNAAVSALVGASGGAPPAPTKPAPNYQTFNLRGLNGESAPYYIDPNDTAEARQSRMLTQQESAREALAQAKADQLHKRDQAAWKGDYDLLSRATVNGKPYFPPNMQFNPEHNYSSDLKDYFDRQKGAEMEGRLGDRLAAAASAPGHQANAQKLSDSRDTAEAWWNQMKSDPTNKDWPSAVKMYNALRLSHPSWEPQRIMLATEQGMKIGGAQQNVEARTAGAQATTESKQAVTQMMQTATGGAPGGAPGGAAKPAPPVVAAPPQVDPAFRVRALALQQQHLSPAAIAAQMAHEGWNNATGQKGSPPQ